MRHIDKLAFENTLIELVQARPLQRLSAGILVPANTRAIMAAGLAGEVRLRAGREVEDELVRSRPLDLGRAYPTSAGRLAEEGVELLVHAVINLEPGEPSRPGQDERAVAAALAVFEKGGTRSVTVPLILLADGRTQPHQEQRTLAAVLTGHLRRQSRLRQVTLAGLDVDYLERIGAELRRAGAIPVDEN